MELKQFFPEIDPEKRLGLGCMRLPGSERDASAEGDDYPKSLNTELCNKMVDRLMEAGFNYFDTAKVYHGGDSEKMIKTCIADRYPREDFVLTDKLSDGCFDKAEDIRPLFEEQLKTCGVDYFDFYLMHAQRRAVYPKYQENHAYEIAQEFKNEGKIRHVGLSFHDDADFLEEILDDHPEVEIVQIQFNYMDTDDPSVQSGRLYEICEQRGIPVLIMEPVRGGALVDLPEAAAKVFDDLGGGYTPAQYAFRFVASFPQVAMVLSGMSDMDMVEENIETFDCFEPVGEEELAAMNEVKKSIRSSGAIPCTACHYCTGGCPQGIRIPELFSDYNNKKLYKTWNSDFYYSIDTSDPGTKASDCIKCGKCEHECPQKLEVRALLEKVAAEFEH